MDKAYKELWDEENKPKIFSKEIKLVLICFAVFFSTVLFLLYSVNSNVDVYDKVMEYQEQLQLKKVEQEAIKDFQVKTELLYEDNERNLYFHSVPTLLVWIFVISTFMAISAGLFFPFLRTIKRTIKQSEIQKPQIIGVIVSLAMLGTIVFAFAHTKGDGEFSNLFRLKPGAELIQYFEILLHNPGRTIQIVVAFMFIVAFVGLSGLFFLNQGITKLDSEPDELEENIFDVSTLISRFKEDMQFYLYSLSLLVVGSIITSGLLRKSILTILPTNNDYFFPIEFVYLYGLSFTLILAISYFPIFYNLKHKSKSVLNNFESLADNFKKEEVEFIKKRVLIDNTAVDNVKMILSIMAPLITSFLPNFI